MTDDEVFAENASIIGALVANLTTIANGDDPTDIGSFHTVEQPDAGLLLAAAFGAIWFLNDALDDGGTTLQRFAQHIGLRAQVASA